MHGVADVCLGLGGERGRFSEMFPCNGTDTFLSIPIWGGGARFERS